MIDSNLAPLEYYRVIVIYCDGSQIWRYVGGIAAHIPPNLGTSTGIPNDPYYNLIFFELSYYGFVDGSNSLLYSSTAKRSVIPAI